MNHEEAHALRRIAAILGTVSTPAERRTIALRIENRISGGDSDPLAFALRHAAALFHPGDAAKTQDIRQRINAAFAAEELVTAIPKGHHHITLSDLAAWPGRPPMAADSPLRYWMPDAPAPQAAPPAPVVGGSNSNAPLPLTTGDIAFCFDGIRWNEQQWRKPLGDKPKWLKSCVAIQGQRGVSETRWSPVLIAAALVHNGHAQVRSVRARFQTKQQLHPWLEAWRTYEADNFDTQ